MRPACKDCKFYRAVNKEGGECKRFPPQVFIGSGQNPVTGQVESFKKGLWPPIAAGDSCGEFAHIIKLVEGKPASSDLAFLKKQAD